MDPFSAMLFALAVTWYGSRSGAARAVRQVRDNHRQRKTTRPQPRPSPSGVRLGSAVSAGLTAGGLAMRDFRAGLREGWDDGVQKARDKRDDRQQDQRGLIDRLLNRMSPADRKTWAKAKTLDDLGERTASWLEGDLHSQPGYAAGFGPDTETEELIPVLAEANRHGYVTHGSQPGVTEDHGRQRASVSGWADPETARRIRETCEAEGLVVIDVPPGEGADSMVVSQDKQDDGKWRDFTDFGPMPGSYFHDWWGRVCHPDALAAVDGAHDVTVIDPVWGRNDRLWPALSRAVDPDTPPASAGYDEDGNRVPHDPVRYPFQQWVYDDDPAPPTASQPAPVIPLTKGTPAMPANPTAEVNSLPELLAFLEQVEKDALAEFEDAQARETRAKQAAADIETVLGQLTKFELGPADLNAVGALLDPTAAAEKAATIATEAADHTHTTASNAHNAIAARHSAMQEAVDATPEPASMDWYKNGQAAA